MTNLSIEYFIYFRFCSFEGANENVWHVLVSFFFLWDRGIKMVSFVTFVTVASLIPYQSKKEGKDQESIQSSTTPDPGYQWESDVTNRHHKREPRGQPFPSR